MSQNPISGVSPHDSLAADRTVGEILATWMRRQRITQKEMALRLGFTQSTMSRKLLGQTPWYLAELVAACDLLGSSLSELFSMEAVGEARSRARFEDDGCAIRDSNPEPAGLTLERWVLAA